MCSWSSAEACDRRGRRFSTTPGALDFHGVQTSREGEKAATVGADGKTLSTEGTVEATAGRGARFLRCAHFGSRLAERGTRRTVFFVLNFKARQLSKLKVSTH